MNLLASDLSSEALLRELWELGALKTGDHPTAIQRGDERGFLLKAHEKDPDLPLSPFYLNLRTPDNPKPGPLTPEVVCCVAQMMRMTVEDIGIAYDVVVGIPNAGDPFAEQFAALSPRKPLLKLGKETGPDKRRILGVVAGDVVPGQTALVIDDLITMAGSKREAIASLEEVGLHVRDVVVFVDREQGGIRELREDGYIVHPIFRISDVLHFYVMEGMMPVGTFNRISRYLFPEG